MTDSRPDKDAKRKSSAIRKAKAKLSQLSPEWVTAFGTWCAIIPITISLIFVWTQIRNIRISVENQTYQSVYETEFGIHKYFLDNPQYRPYFYENVPYAPTGNVDKDKTEKIKLDTLAEWICDFFDDVYQQRDTMSKYTFSKWRKFMKDMYQTSPILQEFIAKHGADWYPEDFITDIQTLDTLKPMPPKKN